MGGVGIVRQEAIPTEQKAIDSTIPAKPNNIHVFLFWAGTTEYHWELLDYISSIYSQGIISRNHFISVYIKKSGRIISRNLADLYLLPHHLLHMTYVIITSENSGGIISVKIACALHQKILGELIS